MSNRLEEKFSSFKELKRKRMFIQEQIEYKELAFFSNLKSRGHYINPIVNTMSLVVQVYLTTRKNIWLELINRAYKRYFETVTQHGDNSEHWTIFVYKQLREYWNKNFGGNK
jgi:hypothetical protein